MKKKHEAIRMCIVCKKRFKQKILQRYFINDGMICTNLSFGRSFYMCSLCFNGNKEHIKKALFRLCKSLNLTLQQEGLKEIFSNG
ncbi:MULTISPECIES: hypothetical protein [unclassified Campylobacter]|uniref:hypothetical protein n=1 Tax=unclassified Campylobacter TaxID=2593542 RepID=UPI0012382ADF|nr:MULTISPECIES: hypothetical protein [unclassified Campylobacter]KAA6226261.1 hypothetical protein FMM55_05220 [Campylobacter sp. LR196d]KAA6226691.1 hypothetical protein FMM57_05405 [Campylobacter sp. LR286c]KAA6227723.1 hypothetical protein FMM54_02310 [Campylobacter sp. LR185c]KAA6231254.1 hypothetical protein FMM58_03580 [Campylobacter sp. LR291e]KAA8603408.1 hypothetical protein CGP82_07390 [Campylobacter sp. LR185c]